MPKTFKQFRVDEFRVDEWNGDEWGSDDDDRRRKDWKLQSRRDQRKKKAGERYSALDDRDDT